MIAMLTTPSWRSPLVLASSKAILISQSPEAPILSYIFHISQVIPWAIAAAIALYCQAFLFSLVYHAIGISYFVGRHAPDQSCSLIPQVTCLDEYVCLYFVLSSSFTLIQ